MSDIDDYLATLDTPQREELERVRTIVRQVAPRAEESISYAMPAYKYNGRPLLYFAAFKHHMSLFPTAAPAEGLKDKLKDYTVSKGTIQFTVENPLPAELIRELVQFRIDIIDGRRYPADGVLS